MLWLYPDASRELSDTKCYLYNKQLQVFTPTVFFFLQMISMIHLCVLLGLLHFNMHKYHRDNLTSSEQTELCGPPEISGAPSKGGPDPKPNTKKRKLNTNKVCFCGHDSISYLGCVHKPLKRARPAPPSPLPDRITCSPTGLGFGGSHSHSQH